LFSFKIFLNETQKSSLDDIIYKGKNNSVVRRVKVLKKKHIWYSTLTVVFMVIALVTMYLPQSANSQKEDPPVTAFVHGYKGTANSFAGMLSRFERRGWGTKALVVYVTNHGNVKTYSINNNKKKPRFVQVVFENNRANFSDSALWLS